MSKTLFGDLNHDLLLQKGVKLIELQSGYNLIRYPNNQPTRNVKNSSNLLEVAFSTDKHLISKTHTINCPFSDHSFVAAILNLKPLKSRATLINSRWITQDKLVKINEMIG